MISTVLMYSLWALFLLSAPVASPMDQGKTTRSPHGPLNIQCQNCHTFSGWKPIRNVPEFDHNKTRYPLRGMHKNVACTQCHLNLVFSNVGHNCADCHADIHRGQMGARCEQCHTVNGWTVSIKSINEHQNRFPLLGAHATVECDACHKGAANGQFKGLSTNCITCHSTAFMNTRSPNHQASGFSTDCQQCHRSFDTWLGASFDHGKLTGFPLTGAHATLECAACHIGNRFQGTPTNCINCHQTDFNNAKDPNHVASGFPQTCAQCHSTTSWLNAKFDHNSMTSFPLTGAHVSVACSQCHINGVYAGTPKDCGSCHIATYNQTTNPNHKTAGFPTDCSICHSTASWAGAVFDHSKTAFPLTGAHFTVSCTGCHSSGVFVGLSTACASCHIKDFNGTTNPNHVAGGFSQTCEVCHNTTAWIPSTFDHSKTVFPLTGKHVGVACSSCHVNGNFATTPTDCYSCHKSDYQGTTNPNHIAAGFATTCQTCHTTAGWTGATFNHTWFRLPHQNAQCTDCHTNTSDYTVFVCTNCHTQALTDPKHTGVRGYVWNSANCYSCHKS